MKPHALKGSAGRGKAAGDGGDSDGNSDGDRGRRPGRAETGARGETERAARKGSVTLAVPVPASDRVEEGHYEKLREWRLGRTEGKPAFTVAANTVL